MRATSSARGRSTASSRTSTARSSSRRRPATVKAALGLLGFEAGGVRLPLVEVDESELAEVRRMVEALRPGRRGED